MRIDLDTRGQCLFGLAFACFGLLFFTFGIIMFLSTYHSLQGTVTSQGQIVSCKIESTTNSDNSIMYVCRPTVHFKTTSGQEIDFAGKFASNIYYEGKEVTVQYHADNPHDALISDPMSLWFGPLLSSGIGLVFIVMGLSISLQSLFKRPESSQVNLSTDW